ncbi:MAG: Tim44/TimA family putative adaptor protein [Tagaea sp.]|nr:Tim44/TimA family putative adaptor protein [Tagaea sp.]
MGDLAFLDIVLFAAVAGFLILRLRSVLGKRTGAEDAERWRARPPERTIERAEQMPDNVTPFPGAPRPAETPAESANTTAGADTSGNPALRAGIDAIRRADPSFDAAGFVEGAKGAFEMIVLAFAQGDTATLKPLLAQDVYQGFEGAIKDRLAAKHTLETTLVGIRTAEIVDAKLENRDAMVTVKFVSEQVNVTRDADGNVVEGEAAKVLRVIDQWTFARDTRSRDPNWALVRTEEPA